MLVSSAEIYTQSFIAYGSFAAVYPISWTIPIMANPKLMPTTSMEIARFAPSYWEFVKQYWRSG